MNDTRTVEVAVSRNKADARTRVSTAIAKGKRDFDADALKREAAWIDEK